MIEDKFIDQFLILFIIFISLIILKLIRILLGFCLSDLLGLVSYCLVIYYQNYRSYNFGIHFYLINRRLLRWYGR